MKKYIKKILLNLLNPFLALSTPCFTQREETISFRLVGLFLKKVYFFQRIYKSINLFLLRPDIKYAFIVPFILDKIPPVGANGVPEKNIFLDYVLAITTIQVFILAGFINIMAYVFVYYYVNNYPLTNIEINYPKIYKIINFFKKRSIITIYIEVAFVLILQSTFIGANIFVIYTLVSI